MYYSSDDSLKTKIVSDYFLKQKFFQSKIHPLKFQFSKKKKIKKNTISLKWHFLIFNNIFN